MEILDEITTYSEIEKIENGQLYIKGALFPFNGMPTPEAIEATNILKLLLRGKFSAIKLAAQYILQYDWAYRIRYMDLVHEMKELTPKEILRLTKLNKQRDYLKVHKKIKPLMYLLAVLVLIPRFKKAAQTFIETGPKLTDQELYWALQKDDYAILGLTNDQKKEEMHRREWTKPPEYVV